MSPFKVTVFLAVGLCLFTNYINAEEAKDNAEDGENVIKVYKRLIPADVLRGLSSCLNKKFHPFVFIFNSLVIVVKHLHIYMIGSA